MEKKEPLCSAGGNGNCYSHSRKHFTEIAQNIKNKKLPYDPATPLLDIYLKNTEILIQKDICSPMFIAALLTVAKTRQRPECHGQRNMATRKNESLPFVKTWIELDDIMLNEIRRERYKQYDFTCK